ncbi:hypothetical protein H4S08_003089 [Coemansia sp. RSA 1365]|nr:hypothetical protein H4S08_003089 [Coemansia sp. RSA 1365]
MSTNSSAAISCSLSNPDDSLDTNGRDVTSIEEMISDLIKRYSKFDAKAMLTPVSDDYCKEADVLLYKYGIALSTNGEKQ